MTTVVSLLPENLGDLSHNTPYGYQVLDHNGQIVDIHQDRLERKQIEATLQSNLQIKRAMLAALPDTVFRLNADGTYLDFGSLEEEPLSDEATEFMGKNVRDLFSQEIAHNALQSIQAALATQTLQTFECALPDADGVWHYEVRITPCGSESVLAIVRDITERKVAECHLQEQHAQLKQLAQRLEQQREELELANARLADLATTDSLTGLKNHRAFQEQLLEEVARSRRHSTPLSLLILDVDNFKSYNDALGHPCGDVALRRVAQQLQECVRETDFIARYGGEEFALILPHTDLENALILATRLRLAVQSISDLPRPLTVSVGVAMLNPTAPDPATLIAEADQALYRAKHRGRNCIVHTPPTTYRKRTPPSRQEGIAPSHG